MAPAGLVNSFLAAIQASLSVLLVISYGAVAARFKLLNSGTAKVISKICVKMFLPALLFTQIGSELHVESANRYLIILIWAFIAHLVSFLIGVFAHVVFGFPDWITAAIMFNNTTSYPLLLIQALDQTGILSSLIVNDESSKQAIERAKSYFLVFATVSSCLTFAVGPRLMDSEHAFESDDKEGIDESTQVSENPTEETGLLGNNQPQHRGSVSFFPSVHPRQQSVSVDDHRRQSVAVIHQRRPSVFPKRQWSDLHPRLQWWALFLYDFLNAPLLGALVGAVVGLVPALHVAFFNDTPHGGIFTAWLTSSLKNIGGLFVPLPVLIAGVSLYLAYQQTKEEPNNTDSSQPITHSTWLTTTLILVIRFVIWPVVSIGVIYLLVLKTDILGPDPILWFAMMLMPTGPPAMKLITLVEVSDAPEEDEHKIAKLLTVSYIISPLLAFTVVASLRASQAGLSV